jgi:MFS family permease
MFAPLMGILADRLGPRKLISIGAIIAVAGLYLLSNMHSLAMFYGTFFMFHLGLGCFAFTVMMTSIAKWFHNKISLASGIVVAGSGVGGLLLPLLVRVIDVYGWRTAMLFIAAGILVIVLPLSAVFRHKPEQYGLLPDGETEAPEPEDGAAVETEYSEVYISTKQALKSRVFWCLGIAVMIHFLTVRALTTHIMPYLSSVNIVRSKAGLISGVTPLVSVAGRLGFGWLGDRTNKKKLIMIAFGLTALGFLCFAYISSSNNWLIVLFIIIYSIGWGGTIVLRPALVRDYFGRGDFGAILGMVNGINMAGSIIGPPVAGWVYDTWSSYRPIWLIYAALPVISILLISATSAARSTDSRTGAMVS